MKGKCHSNPTFYVSMSTIESIHKHLNLPLGRGGLDKDISSSNVFSNGTNNYEEDEVIGETIDEEVIDEAED